MVKTIAFYATLAIIGIPTIIIGVVMMGFFLGSLIDWVIRMWGM